MNLIRRANLLVFFSLLSTVATIAQVTIGANRTPKSTLEIVAQKGAIPDGVMIPKLTAAELCAQSSKYTADQFGSIVYISDTASVTYLYIAANCQSIANILIHGEGYYYFDGQLWEPVKGDDWSTRGNKQHPNSMPLTRYYNYFGRLDQMPMWFIWGGEQFFAVGPKFQPGIHGYDNRPAFFDNLFVKDTDLTYGAHGYNYNYFLQITNRSVKIGNGYQATTPSPNPFDANTNYVPLVLDAYKADITDAQTQNGSMYYNSELQKFRCFENGVWVNCTDGAGALVIKKVTADYTVTNEDVILCEATSGTLNITLPTTGVATGKKISIADKGLGCTGIAISPTVLYNNAGTNISGGMTMTYLFVGDGKWLCTGATHSHLTFGL